MRTFRINIQHMSGLMIAIQVENIDLMIGGTTMMEVSCHPRRSFF